METRSCDRPVTIPKRYAVTQALLDGPTRSTLTARHSYFPCANRFFPGIALSTPTQTLERLTPEQSAVEGQFLFLSQLLRAPVFVGTERVGHLIDLMAEPTEAAYPKIQAMRVMLRKKSQLRRVEWDEVISCEPGRVQVKSNESLLALQMPPHEIPLSQDVLDRQMLDTNDAKVERVNDLHLLRARGELRVAHVDVGFRGLVRRMGWQGFVDAMVRTLKPSAVYLTREQFIPWKHVKPLASGNTRVRLDVARDALADLHPADLAEILADLDRRERAVLFRELSVESAADALEESSPGLQRELINAVDSAKAADLLEAMPPDAAADLLENLPQAETDVLLAQMEPAEAREVEQLLTYDEHTAGGMMTPDFVHLKPTFNAGEALADLRRQAETVEHLQDAFVLGAGERMVGWVTLRSLLLAPAEAPLASIMQEHPAPVLSDDSPALVADLAAKYDLYSLPVESADGRLLGVITVDDILIRVLRG